VVRLELIKDLSWHGDPRAFVTRIIIMETDEG
jgi:hypothetical protein